MMGMMFWRLASTENLRASWICEEGCGIILDCKELRSEEIEDGLICAGLRQMVSRANQDGAEINYRHYQECEPYLLAFCNHKIMQAELLVIVDDYSKIPENCITEFNRLLRELCKRLTLHVVVITDTLKPSEKFRLNEAFMALIMSLHGGRSIPI